MKSSLTLMAAVVVFGGSQVASAALIDGTVNGGEYAETIVDSGDGAAAFVGTGLDMSSVSFDIAAGQFQVGVDTADTFDFNGDPTALPFSKNTRFSLKLDSLSNPGNQFVIDLLFGDSSGSPILLSSNVWVSNDGGATFSNAGTTGLPAVGDDMEFEVDLSMLSNLGADFEFAAQLDGSGEWQDDQISGTVIGIPEPATAALLGLGGLALARRRR